MKLKQFLLIILFITLILIINCTTYIYQDLSEDEAIKINYLDNISIGFLDILVDTENPSLYNNLKETITDYILDKMDELENYTFPNDLLVAIKDTSNIVNNNDSAQQKATQLLDTEISKEEENEEEEENEGSEGKNNTSNNQEENEEETDTKTSYNDITNKPQLYNIITIDDIKKDSYIGEIFGKDPSEIKKEESMTFSLQIPSDTIDSEFLKSEDFSNITKLQSKIMNIEKDLVITSLVVVGENDINIKIVILNNILLQITDVLEYSINLNDYLKGNINIEDFVWSKLKRVFFGNKISSLEINTNINNALIYIDDKFYGRTKRDKNDNFTYKIDSILSGSHKIRIVKSGYEKVEGYIFLDNDKISILNIDLKELSSNSNIILYIEQTNTDVWLDMDYIGNNENNNKYIIENVVEGIHKVRIEKVGYNPSVHKVIIDGSNDIKLSINLSLFDEHLYDPDYRSSKFSWYSDVFIYGSLLSLGATIGLYYHNNTFDDELYSVGNTFRYDDVRNNYLTTQGWRDGISTLTILMMLGALTFKWIELEQRNIQIGSTGEYLPIDTIFYLIPKNNVSKLALGFNLSYYF